MIVRPVGRDNGLGIRDLLIGRKKPSNRSTSGPFAFAWKELPA